MTYVQHINALIQAKVAQKPGLVVYGQNVTAGSCLSGLTRGLQTSDSNRIFNTQNSENTLTGLGFGMMIQGVSSIFFMKQLDFLLLGMDHLVNTFNIARRLNNGASFTIVAIVVDHGYEGPQSCLNNLDDFCSMAHIPGYVINNGHDAETIINHHLEAPGFRIICVSQRLFPTDLIWMDDGFVESDADGDVFRYATGTDATMVACNFSFPQAFTVWEQMKKKGMTASLFSINASHSYRWEWIREDLGRTRKLILLDDSKSDNRSSDRLLLAMKDAGVVDRVLIERRHFSSEWMKPNPDILNVDAARIIRKL